MPAARQVLDVVLYVLVCPDCGDYAPLRDRRGCVLPTRGWPDTCATRTSYGDEVELELWARKLYAASDANLSPGQRPAGLIAEVAWAAARLEVARRECEDFLRSGGRHSVGRRKRLGAGALTHVRVYDTGPSTLHDCPVEEASTLHDCPVEEAYETLEECRLTLAETWRWGVPRVDWRAAALEALGLGSKEPRAARNRQGTRRTHRVGGLSFRRRDGRVPPDALATPTAEQGGGMNPADLCGRSYRPGVVVAADGAYGVLGPGEPRICARPRGHVGLCRDLPWPQDLDPSTTRRREREARDYDDELAEDEARLRRGGR